MKVLFINPPIRLNDKPRNLPHGLAILANIVRTKFPDIGIKFLDWNAHRYSLEKVKTLIAEEYHDLIFIGGLIPVYSTIIELASIIKKIHPTAIIVTGGSAAMSVPDLLLKHSEVDVICKGEGELALPDFIEFFKRTKSIDFKLFKNTELKGFIIKNHVQNSLLDLPDYPYITDLDTQSALPAYDLLPMDIYLKNHVVGLGRDIDFISSRGCPYQCTFCYQPWGRSFRAHSPDFIIDGIKHLIKKYNVQFISFQDDEFMVNKKRLYEFCEKRNSEIPNILWSATGRANIVTDDLMKITKNSGCTTVSYGFESGSPRMLKSMKKNISLNDMENAVYLNRKYGYPIPVSFILGLPGETRESCNETLTFVKKNNLHLNSLMFATPYPGTAIYDYAITSNKIKSTNIHDFVMKLGDARDFVINLTDDFTDKELIDQYHYMIKEGKKHYTPLSVEESNKKIRSLYGKLANDYFNQENKDTEHRTKYGAVDIF